MNEIKKCPFCGGIAKTFHNPDNTEEEKKLLDKKLDEMAKDMGDWLWH